MEKQSSSNEHPRSPRPNLLPPILLSLRTSKFVPCTTLCFFCARHFFFLAILSKFCLHLQFPAFPPSYSERSTENHHPSKSDRFRFSSVQSRSEIMSNPAASKGVPGSTTEEGKEPYRAVAPDPRGLSIGSLTFEEISKANRAAQIDGVVGKFSLPRPLSPTARIEGEPEKEGVRSFGRRYARRRVGIMLTLLCWG